jgi:outer membrane protein OmpA-like peptidoglycan-associated protein
MPDEATEVERGVGNCLRKNPMKIAERHLSTASCNLRRKILPALSVYGGAAHLAWALLCAAVSSVAVVHAAELTEADIIRQLTARPSAATKAPDPDAAFANGDETSKSLGGVRRPDTNGACLADNIARTNTKELVIVARPPSGAPQIDLYLQYELGSYNLGDKDKQQLDTLARAMNNSALQHARFTIAGHTDASGDRLINEKLSCARALAARTYLIGKGVATDRLGAYGFGSSQPVASGASAAENRRVEIRRAND